MLHERLALVGLHWWPEAGLNYMWLALGIPLAVVVALIVVPLSRALPGRTRWAVLGAFWALHDPGCSRGLNPPVSSRDLAM